MAQLSVYEQLLGEDFYKLHPKIQQRYSKQAGTPFEAQGIMHQVATGYKWLSPMYKIGSQFKFLLPEGGRNIPFHLKSVMEILPSGEAIERWDRTFYFPTAEHRFKSFMTVNAERTVAIDHFGEPNVATSELKFSVTKEGRLIIQTGAQYAKLLAFGIPLPRMMQGIGLVEEGYDEEKEKYTIHLSTRNPLLGQFMAYSGEFEEIIK